MGRPSQNLGPHKAAGKSGKSGKVSKNPLIAWFQKRKDAREEAKAEADKNITERKAKNEERIYHKLNSINFGASPLPDAVLDKKQFPEQPYGDIEFQILGAIERIQNNTQDYTGLNIQNIDNGIYQIAFLAKQAIDGGHANAAIAACHALSVTIGEIRDKIPSVPAVLQKDFIESAEKYIDVWIDYIANCTVLDGLENNAKIREETIKSTQAALDTERDAMADKMANDPAYKHKFERIQHEKYAIDGSTWDAEMISLYQQLLSIRVRDSSLSFEILCHNDDLQNVIVHQRILAGFLTKLRTIPQPQDPNLMNKFKTLIEETKNEAAAQDQQFNEFFEEMDRIDSMIEQLANSPGNLRAKEEAEKQVAQIVERAKKKQLEAYGITEDQKGGSQIHLFSVEELEQIKKDQEEAQKKKEEEEQRAAQLAAQIAAQKAAQEQQEAQKAAQLAAQIAAQKAAQEQQETQQQQQVNVNRPRNKN